MLSQNPAAPGAAPIPKLPLLTWGLIVVTAFFAATYLAGLFLLTTAGLLVSLENSLQFPMWLVIATNMPFLYAAAHIAVWMFRKTYDVECALEVTFA